MASMASSGSGVPAVHRVGSNSRFQSLLFVIKFFHLQGFQYNKVSADARPISSQRFVSCPNICGLSSSCVAGTSPAQTVKSY
jgi:hypothetical protein